MINQDIGLLFNWLDKLGCEKCYHPLSLSEIQQHSNPKVVATMEAKIKNYNVLKTLAPESEEIAEIRKSDKTVNDTIDTTIVNEVFKNRVDYLITEDRGIHNKAKKLNVSHKIFNIDDFIDKCRSENPGLTSYKVLAVEKEYFGNISIDDDFFDSFKEDYVEFPSWFLKKSDNVSYICQTDGKIRAFLYLKVEGESEKYDDIEPRFKSKKRLKIGTFKVTSTGFRLGERFLKIIIDNALVNSVDEIYVTVFDKREDQQRLIDLLKDWGFQYHGIKSTDNGVEQVFIKPFFNVNALESPRFSYPFISRGTNKWVVPIYPSYHTELFPDSILNNESSQDFQENEPHRNAIRKVYISRSINRSMKSGDLVLFYRTGGHYHGVISTIGVVESCVDNIPNLEAFIDLCRKRSVFSDEELAEHWNYNPLNRPFVVNFLYVGTFPKPKVNLMKLREDRIIQNAPRGFELLSDSKFDQIIKLGRLDESYFVD